MSQDIFDSIDPAISGTELAEILNDFKAAIVSGLSGTSRPTELDQGGGWIDTTNDPTYWSYKIWTGTADVEVFRLHLDTNLASVALAVEDFSVKKISADTVGAVLKLVKQRIANSGQVLDGDTVGEIQFVGRANDASNPVVAKMVWVASDNQTSSAFGGEFAFHSVADASGTLTKHMRFVDGLVEFLVPAKVNSLRLVAQSVATSATIAQLSASKAVVEMTGSTVTDIQGINSGQESQVVTVHNRSTAIVTLKHQNGTAAANDRMKLPNDADYAINPEASATLYYCTTDSRWKLKSTSDKNFSGTTVRTYYGLYNSFTVPGGVTNVRVRAYRKQRGGANNFYSGLIDMFGSAYAFGVNNTGQLGVGDVNARSSPVAVLGSHQFIRISGHQQTNFGLRSDGSLYSWGDGTNGVLGLNDTSPRSSPVAVTGGLKYNVAYTYGQTAFGITTGGLAYAWGYNGQGQVGVGDVTPRSNPTAVLGGLRFLKLAPLSGSNEGCCIGLSTTGALYGWGNNVSYNLGNGDANARSSPVAVLGGLTFMDVGGGQVSGRYFYAGLNQSGAAYAWGSNVKGQLGTGDTVGRSSPVAVVGGLTFQQIFTHPFSESVFGLTEAGALYAWGDNLQGILGVGDNTAKSSPVAVLGGLTFSKIGHFRGHVVGLTADGTAYAWGSNASGELGVGDVVSRSSPVAVVGGLKFFDVKAALSGSGNGKTYGFTADGVIYAWGDNTQGVLGVGDVTNRSSPVLVLGSFRADVEEISFNAQLTVVPATAYNVVSGPGQAYFGMAPLGHDTYKVEVEYLA